MQAIRKIVSKENFKNFNIPEEFGDRFEMILLPIEDREVGKIKNGELRMENERGFDEMSDEERWEKFGNWDPSAKSMDMCYTYVMKKMEEYGEEDFESWQK